MSREPKSEALQELYEELVGDNPKKQASYERDLVDIKAAQIIYDMRTSAGLSQRELAKRVGTTASPTFALPVHFRRWGQ